MVNAGASFNAYLTKHFADFEASIDLGIIAMKKSITKLVDGFKYVIDNFLDWATVMVEYFTGRTRLR